MLDKLKGMLKFNSNKEENIKIKHESFLNHIRNIHGRIGYGLKKGELDTNYFDLHKEMGLVYEELLCDKGFLKSKYETLSIKYIDSIIILSESWDEVITEDTSKKLYEVSVRILYAVVKDMGNLGNLEVNESKKIQSDLKVKEELDRLLRNDFVEERDKELKDLFKEKRFNTYSDVRKVINNVELDKKSIPDTGVTSNDFYLESLKEMANVKAEHGNFYVGESRSFLEEIDDIFVDVSDNELYNYRGNLNKKKGDN